VPWNASFGLGVSTKPWWLFAVVVSVTLLSLVALAASHGGPLGVVDKVRLGLNVPYLLAVLGFAGFAIYEFVHLSGGGATPPGVGPGVLAGVAGACLAAQPVLTGGETLGDKDGTRRFDGWFVYARRMASWAKFVVVVSVVLTLYLRTRDVFPNVFDSSIAWPSIAAVVTAVAYAAVAVAAVWIGLRWMQLGEPDARLATVALGIATVVGSLLVWLLGIGRDVDAFHGIAQATSTAGVGYEGYVAWAAGAAIFAPLILRQTLTALPPESTAWQDAARKCLLLIVVWCGGTAVLRIFDVIVMLSSGLPFSPSDSAVLFLFDLITAGLALWLRANAGTTSEHRGALSRLSGVLFVLLVCRVVLGVGLSRPILYAAPPVELDAAAYGNTLAHQLTSTFDVVLCVLALAVLAALGFLPRRRGDRDSGAPAEYVPAAPAEHVTVAPESPDRPIPQVPSWQAPSQWAPPTPHRDPEHEPHAEAVQQQQQPAEDSSPITEVLPRPEQEAVDAWEPEEPSNGLDPSAPATESAERDESAGEGPTYASTGRHRHRLPPRLHDTEE
jgi:hypothetical protein